MTDRPAHRPRSARHRPAATLVARRTPPGRVRWVADLTPEAARAYATSVAAVVTPVERRLGPGVLADRARTPSGEALSLVPWTEARRRWRAAARRGSGGPGRRALLVADVRACYASITPASVAHALAEAGAPPPAIAAVLACLERFADDGVRGLPIGPAASAVLANAVLAAGDDALRGCGLPHLRWVDDTVAFAPSTAAARRALDRLRSALAGEGLELHEGKTRLVLDPEEARHVLGAGGSPGAARRMA
jgi:hypothetical protein